METTPKNIQFDISHYTDATGKRGQPFIFTIFSKPVLYDKVDTRKHVSVQHKRALSGFNQSLTEFIGYKAEQGNWNEKRREVNC